MQRRTVPQWYHIRMKTKFKVLSTVCATSVDFYPLWLQAKQTILLTYRMFTRWGFAVLVIITSVGITWFLRTYSVEKFRPDMIQGQVVCICGASSGIGEELAYQYAKLGAQLILAARRKNKLENIRTKCEQLGSQRVHVVIADFGNPADTQLLYQETLEKFGRIDTLILNHVQPYFGFWRNRNLSHSAVHNAVEVNLLSYVKLATLFTPLLNDSGGKIGIVSSMAGIYAIPQAALYSSCKHALHGFFSTYRIELALQNFHNVSITMCVLGPIATDMFLAALPPNSTDAYGFPISSLGDSATSIIHGVAKRQKQVYFPFYMKYYHYFTFLLPDFLDDLMIQAAKKQS